VSYIPNPWESGNQAAEKRLGPVLSSTSNPCKVESQQPTASTDKIHKELQSLDTLKYLALLMLSTAVPTFSIVAPKLQCSPQLLESCKKDFRKLAFFCSFRTF